MDTRSFKDSTIYEDSRISPWRYAVVGSGLLGGIFALFFLSRFNYLLFHSLVEFSSIAVAVTVFSIGWHARHFSRNDSFTLLAVAFLTVAGLDLLHMLTYKGMGIFPDLGVDVPTQFWIAARTLQALAYLASGWLLLANRKTGSLDWAGGFLALGILMALAIWPMRIFPVCLTEQGLTPFKLAAEYTISFILAISAWLFWRGRLFLDSHSTRLLLISIGAAILSELSFTLYQDVYGVSNWLGHVLKVVSVCFVYRALVLGALRNPYQSLFRDLTRSHKTLDEELEQRRQAEMQLRSTNRELENFVRTVAHDLRSPLTVFISGIDFFRRQLKDQLSEPLFHLLNSIEQKGWEMTRLLEDLLQWARIGHIDHPAEPVDTINEVNRALADLGDSIIATGSRVIVEQLPGFRGHPTLIYQLFTNLIGNAVRYAGGADSPIVVGGTRSESTLRLFVRDHGPGIPDEEKGHLGEFFFRGGNAREQKGNGIGLAIVQKIARHYRGRFWVEDTPGGGATFWVELQEPAFEPDPEFAT